MTLKASALSCANALAKHNFHTKLHTIELETSEFQSVYVEYTIQPCHISLSLQFNTLFEDLVSHSVFHP